MSLVIEDNQEDLGNEPPLPPPFRGDRSPSPLAPDNRDNQEALDDEEEQDKPPLPPPFKGETSPSPLAMNNEVFRDNQETLDDEEQHKPPLTPTFEDDTLELSPIQVIIEYLSSHKIYVDLY